MAEVVFVQAKASFWCRIGIDGGLNGGKFMTRSTRLITALLIGASFASSAMAATPLTRTSIFRSNSVEDSQQLNASVFAADSSARVFGERFTSPVRFRQFDTAGGILVGARVGLSDVRTASNVKVGGSVLASGNFRTIEAETSLSAVVSGTGITSFTNAPTGVGSTCSNSNCTGLAVAPTITVAGATLNGTATVAAASLGGYVGVDDVLLRRGATGSSTVITGGRAVNGFSSAFYSFIGGAYSITYDYLNFASPSFEVNSVRTSGDIDFGTRELNSGPATLNFTIYNIGNDNSAGVSLIGITRDGNEAQFSSTASTFTSLAGGSSLSYSMTFAMTSLGTFNDRFRFILADSAPGGIGGRAYFLDLGVTGATIPVPVPEPATWAMLIVGFGVVGTSARRRRTMTVST